ncbi:MAG: S-layer homology domain-containing protein [Chloroflexota bacterium]
MIRAPRVRRPSRPVLLTILVTALLAFPMGIALASHQFSDVPNSNAFHADIDALVDAGVTAGCGSGRYCPKANVTREQMAAFMNRLGALAPGKTPVVNAAELEGRDAASFTTHWLNVRANGIIRSHSVGLDGVQVLRPATSPTGTYCITLPDSAGWQHEVAVGTVQDSGGGFQSYGIAVTTTFGHDCNSTGFDIAVDTTVNGAAQDVAFNLLIPVSPAGSVIASEE